MNIAGVVILYKPADGLVDRMNSYKEGLKKMIVIDNSELKAKPELIKMWEGEHISYLHDGKNGGIAKRLNQAAQIAITENYDWLLTMDQDSYFKEGDFAYYLNCLVGYTEKEKVAQFGLAYEKNTVVETSCVQKQVSKLITSGSVINLEAYKNVGHFDENLFIDGVDSEYGLRAHLKGYFNVQFIHIKLEHAIGEESYHRSLKSLKNSPRILHNPIRLYYMTRNFLYIRTFYKSKLDPEVNMLFHSLMYHIKNNLLYNKSRMEVLKNIWKGIADFRAGKFGKKIRT
jgi:rhamnosyltransferase